MATAAETDGQKVSGIGTLALGALGVVYGDIGTSPLYTIKTAVDWAGGSIAPEEALGILSLIVWTLVIITSVKYVAVIMRADNDGEGGILALMSLLGIKHGRRPFVIGVGMLGAALLFGDGAITPAISVLSALEGLKTPAPAIEPYVVPLSVAVLIGLFSLQSQGTGRICRIFGPVMTLWFLTIGALGLASIWRHPDVLWALDPRVGLTYVTTHGTGRISYARRGVSLRHGRGGALRRHGPFRPPADTRSLGMGSSCRPCCSITPAKPRSWWTAPPLARQIRSSIFVRRRCNFRWSRWRRSRPLSRASRSSPAPSR